MACCRCNRTGRCRNCACVKAGNPCQNCLPGRLGQCLNTEPTVRPEPTASPTASPTAPYFELITQPPPANPAPSLTPPPPPPLPPPLPRTSATSLQILNASSCLPVASFPGLRGGEGRPGTHCARMRVIIAKFT